MNFKILVYGHYLFTDNVFLNAEESLVTSINNFVAFYNLCLGLMQKIIKYLTEVQYDVVR
jgi:hypothetical protein